MHCLVFNLEGPSDDPVDRASVMIHEAWPPHQIQVEFDADIAEYSHAAAKGLQLSGREHQRKKSSMSRSPVSSSIPIRKTIADVRWAKLAKLTTS
jgi:hypothetical protein